MALKYRFSVTLPPMVFDGSTSTVSVDLSQPPIGIVFNPNKLPLSITSSGVSFGDTFITFTGSFSGTIATIVFASTPPAGAATFGFEYFTGV